MSEARWITARRQLMRLVLLTAGLAPVVALVLIGLSRLQRDTPEWVYWKAELIFLIALEITLRGDGVPFPVGYARARFSLFPRAGQGGQPARAGPRLHALDRPPVQPGLERGGLRGLALLVPSLHGRAGRRPRNPPNARNPPCGSHSPSGKSIFARISPTRRVTTKSIWSSWESRAPRECPTTAGCRSARSSPGS